MARIGRTGDCRWWLAGGVVAGLGAESNHLTGISAIAVLIAALLSGARRMVVPGRRRRRDSGGLPRSRPVVAGAARAVIAMTLALNHRNGGVLHIAIWVVGNWA